MKNINVVHKHFPLYFFIHFFCLDKKKITFDKNDQIGEGSQDTFVYKWVDNYQKEGITFTINHMIIEALLGTVAVKRVVSKQFNELVKGEVCKLINIHIISFTFIRLIYCRNMIGILI